MSKGDAGAGEPQTAPATGSAAPSAHPVLIAERYRVERQIGQGGMGRVMLAFDVRLGRRVAIKMLAGGARPEIALKRFELEARAAAALNHPNIVDVHDVGVWHGEPFIVSELLEGETLRERLRRGALASDDVARLALQLARGLAAAHEKGVIHRDLKPDNLFVTRDGLLKVLDFGIAKLVDTPGPSDSDAETTPHANTDTGAVLGTVAYMSPEQVRGKPVDPRSDLFACGAIIYEMLSARRAFEGETPFVIGNAILSSEPPPLPESVPQPLVALIQRCLRKSPQERFQSARELEEAVESLPEGTALAERRRHLTAGHLVAAAAVVAVAVVIGFVAVLAVRHAPPSAHEEAGAASIAVLPFADLSPGRDQEYFADGLAEEILDALTHVHGLRVAGRTSSFSFKGKADDVRSVAQKLRVKAVLEGSVRRDGNQLRITAQLLDADGFHLWSQAFDREQRGIFAVQEEISLAVVQALREKLGLAGSAGPSRPRETTPDAHREYLIARQLLNRGSASGFRQAEQGFAKALDLDPRYAPAWTGLALAAWYASNLAATETAARAEALRAMDAAEKAAELAPDDGEALAVRGYLRGLVRWDWSGAHSDLDRALQANAGSAGVWSRYALLLASLGRLPDALTAARKAAELDPLSADAWDNLGYVANASGEWALVREASARALQVAPEQAYAAHHVVVASLLEGHAAEALKEFERAPEEIFRLQGVAMAQHDLGHREESDRAIGELSRKYGHNSAFQIAQAYAWRADADHAFEWLERGFRQHDGGLGYVKCDPLLRRIRADARYPALLRELNLPE